MDADCEAAAVLTEAVASVDVTVASWLWPRPVGPAAATATGGRIYETKEERDRRVKRGIW